MPAVSKAQFKMMAAAEHNPAFAEKVGISPSKAAEIVDATSSFAKLPAHRHKKKGKRHGFKRVIARP